MRFSVNNQIITVEDTELVSGSSNLYTAEFNFSEDWNGFIRVAVFQQENGGSAYHVPLTEDSCVIPWESISQPGYLKVGVYGVLGNTHKPTIWCQPVFVDKGTNSAQPSEPSPSVYEELLEKTREAVGTAGQAVEIATEAVEIATNAETTAGQASTTATEAKEIAINAESIAQMADKIVYVEDEEHLPEEGEYGKLYMLPDPDQSKAPAGTLQVQVRVWGHWPAESSNDLFGLLRENGL